MSTNASGSCQICQQRPVKYKCPKCQALICDQCHKGGVCTRCIAAPPSPPAADPKVVKGLQNCMLVGCLVPLALMVIFGLFAGSSSDNDSPSSSSRPSASTSLRTGDQGILSANNPGGNVPVAVSKEAFEALLKADRAGDEYGRQQLLLSGQVMPVATGTPVLVLGIGFGENEVRILSGPYSGRSGWTITEFVRKQ